jgi:outer membrane protein OmpA-like peptidoglycan-associated protein
MPDDISEIEDQAAVEAPNLSKTKFPPLVAAAVVVIAALFGVLIGTALKGGSSVSSADQATLAALQAETKALHGEYNRERIAMGLRPIEGESEPVEDISGRLKKDADTLVALAGSYQKMLAENERDLMARKAEILRSEKLQQSLAADRAKLNAELQRALVGGADSDILRRDLSDLKAQRDALSAELASTRQNAGAPADEYNDLKRRFDETLRAKEFFEARVKELQGDLTMAKLFASSEKELLPAAVELVRSLRELENKPDSEITTAYSNLGAKLGAAVKKELIFPAGVSALTPEDDAAIRSFVFDVPDGDLILAIGYASETGNVDDNRTLSSERATAAAQLISSIKRPGQLTQAVYLGQTDRFGSKNPERNQLVEIWHIRRK